MQDIFTREKWKWIEEEYENWWTGKSEKPIINLTFDNAEPGMKRPEGLISNSTFLYDLKEPAQSIAEKMEYQARCRRYEFHSFPLATVNFGALYKVEFIGCRPTVSSDSVWFEPAKKVPASELSLRRDPDSVYLPRVRDLYRDINERFSSGYVINGMGLNKFGPGQAFALVAEYFGSEEMSYLLYDEPEEVKRLTREAAQTMDEIGEELYSLTTNAIGYSGWGNMYAPEPWNLLLCDYSAMIGPKHFDEFLLDDLAEGVRRSPKYNFYHLDGPGQIIHMDKILALPELRCMQWVPLPNGSEELTKDVCSRIHKAGKNQWVIGPIERAVNVARHNGTAKGIYWTGHYPMSEYDRVMKLADQLMNMG